MPKSKQVSGGKSTPGYLTDDEPGPSRRETALRFAELAEGLDEPARRRTVLNAVHHRFWGLSVDTWLIMHCRDHPCSEDEIFSLSYGNSQGREYWRAWLMNSTPQDLADLLAIHTAHNEDHRYAAAAALMTAAKFAPSVAPALLVKWWAENPDTSQYISPSLAAFLEGDACPNEPSVPGTNSPSTSKVSPVARRRGKPPVIREAVKQKMRSYVNDGNDLDALREKQMERQFGACRDTCRQARDEVLAELDDKTIPDKSPTIDK